MPAAMTSPERVRTAFTGQPDRVPVVEFAVHPRVAAALVPDCRDVPDALDRLGLDAVCCGADWRRPWESDTQFIDEWGVLYGKGLQMIDHPVGGPVQIREDLLRWQPPDPDAEWRLATFRDLVARFKGKRAVFFYHRAAFMWSAYVTGLEHLLELFAVDPDFAEELMDRVVACNEKIIRNAIRLGAEAIHVADDYAANDAPFFSPGMFRRLVLPRLKRVVDAIHEEGAFAIKHTDGNIWPLLDDMLDAGIDGLNPLEPVAGMHLADVKQHCGDRVCLVGNIDCGHLLSHGTPGEVEAAVRQAIEDGAAGGRFMLSSSNSIHASVRPENYRAMIEAGRKYGVYRGYFPGRCAW
ncbi:MAG: hypothetical protein HYU66_14645 [Armatimonadetes bacterium]|nr:hypothetical protein [Armatimonadota bacterium]